MQVHEINIVPYNPRDRKNSRIRNETVKNQYKDRIIKSDGGDRKEPTQNPLKLSANFSAETQ